jgi:hypothetical protein
LGRMGKEKKPPGPGTIDGETPANGARRVPLGVGADDHLDREYGPGGARCHRAFPLAATG